MRGAPCITTISAPASTSACAHFTSQGFGARSAWTLVAHMPSDCGMLLCGVLPLSIAAGTCTLPGFGTAQLRVHVLAPTQRAVAEARVMVTDSHGQQVFAGLKDRAGQISRSLTTGRFFLHARHDGFEEQITSVSMSPRDQGVAVSLAPAEQKTSIRVTRPPGWIQRATRARPTLFS